jgi:hypothetical protein
MYLYIFRPVVSDADKVPADPAALGGPWFQGSRQKIRIVILLWVSFTLDFVLPTEDSILDSCCEIWE